MIITRIAGGIGNQLFQYATGRRLAQKWNTELKLDKSLYDSADNIAMAYALDKFNITATIATPEEIKPLKEACNRTGIGKEGCFPMPYVLDYPDNTYLNGNWCNEILFWDIRDILLQEITLRNSISRIAEIWKEKILTAECAVSMHFRHGDFLYNPSCRKKDYFHIPPLDYYVNCIRVLKQAYKNLTVFVFSNNINWVKANFHLDVPMEFVEGMQDGGRFNKGFDRDVEELYLMSLCKHSINPRSAFSWWGAYLNQNPDKKIFLSKSSTAEKAFNYQYSLEPKEKNSPLDSDRWIEVPFDPAKQPLVKMRPWFSLLLVVNDDVETIEDTLITVLSQDYKYYEIIIIDNASTDGSSKICKRANEISDKITLIKLYDKISDGAAWNMAFNVAQGNYVLFIKGDERFVADALSSIYATGEARVENEDPFNESIIVDIVNSVVWLEESDDGDITSADKKFALKIDSAFEGLQETRRMKLDEPTILKILSDSNAAPLATRIFKRKFLLDNGIKFNENLAQDAEIPFLVKAMSQAREMIFTPEIFYVAPKKF